MRHRFHALCPYFAMFPESFSEQWIDKLTSPGDSVLDPFCGRGTTALSALLMGRKAIASDINDVAFCLTKAKTSSPPLGVLRRRITQLEKSFDGRTWKHPAQQASTFFHLAYSRKTLEQLLYLRKTLSWRLRNVDCMIAALVLGALHGEKDKSSGYLSNQMPRTISTKPGYSIRYWKARQLKPPERDVFALLREKIAFRYESPRPDSEGLVFQTDIRRLPRLLEEYKTPIRCVVTSPPYFDVTNYEEDQWLRLWFLGGPDRPTTGRLSTDDRHGNLANYWRFMGDMWRSLGRIVAKNGDVVIRIGCRKTTPSELRRRLLATAHYSGRKVAIASWTVSVLRNRQTNSFRPGSKGCTYELDCHFRFRD